ncbi:50S ribosomal protein L13 [Candidatus Parcubacteria bacterium]|nr:MAG: 50S ribosomal protein L13 [Candidatus Parcubacteria bacterium]
MDAVVHKIDASGEILGRVASRAAHLLMGKGDPKYTPNQKSGPWVEIVNAEKIRFSGSKLDQKKYKRYSGYPGGMKQTPLRVLLEKHPDRVLYTAVAGMLPANRLKKQRLKRLKIVFNK